MNEIWIFAYGSNMNLEDLKAWLLERKSQAEAELLMAQITTKGHIAVLENHALVWNYYSPSRKGGAANVEERKGCHVYGVAFQIDEEWFRLFDAKEGHPTYYARQKQTVKLQPEESSVSAWVYYANPSRVSASPEWPTSAYKATVVAAARCWKLPDTYIAELEEVSTRD